MIGRRDFITFLGGAAAWPLTARAQQSKMPHIGALVLNDEVAQAFANEFRAGLRELGHIEGRNYTLEFRSADGNANRLPELAAELVHRKVDVIVAVFTPCALAAQQAT